MSHGEAVVDELFQRVYADLDMIFNEFSGHFQIALGRFDSFRDHRLITDQQQGSRRDLVEKADRKDRGRFHVDGIGPDLFQVFFKFLVMFPDPAVSRINSAGPIIDGIVTDRRGDRFLQREGGQRRHLRGKIVVGRALSANGRDGQDQIAQLIAFFEAAAFAQKENGLGLDRRQKIHNGRCRWAAHAEIDDRDIAGSGALHGFMHPNDLDTMPFREQMNVIIKVSQENIPAEILQLFAGISRQPILDNFFFALHFVNLANSFGT